MLLNILPSILALFLAGSVFLLFKKIEIRFIDFQWMTVYQLFYSIIIFLPFNVGFLWVSGSELNWIGKVMAIVYSILFLGVLKKKFQLHNLFELKIDQGSIKKILLTGCISMLCMCSLTFIFSPGKSFDLERLVYQLLIPGIDEEIWRGIFIVFFVSVLRPGNFRLGHPAIWIATITFSFGHALYFHEKGIGFLLESFIISGVLGHILGWMTLKSKSIIPSIILHNMINFSTNAIEMLV